MGQDSEPFGVSKELSRRRFAMGLVTSATVSLLSVEGNASVNSEPSPVPESGPGEKPEDMAEADWREVQAKLANLLRVYGERLTTEERGRVVQILKANQYLLASIRRYIVQNGDPSACTLVLQPPAPDA